MVIRPLTLLFFICALTGLDSGCGGGANAPPSSLSLPPKSAVPTPTLLRTLYRVTFSGTDRMTTQCCSVQSILSYDGLPLAHAMETGAVRR